MWAFNNIAPIGGEIHSLINSGVSDSQPSCLFDVYWQSEEEDFTV